MHKPHSNRTFKMIFVASVKQWTRRSCDLGTCKVAKYTAQKSWTLTGRLIKHKHSVLLMESTRCLRRARYETLRHWVETFAFTWLPLRSPVADFQGTDWTSNAGNYPANRSQWLYKRTDSRNSLEVCSSRAVGQVTVLYKWQCYTVLYQYTGNGSSRSVRHAASWLCATNYSFAST